MEDFLENYVPGESHCPLTLLMNYRNSKDEVVSTIISDERFHGIYDITYLNKVLKSSSNPSLREEAYSDIERVLINTAKEYIQTSVKLANIADDTLLVKANELNCELDDYSKPEETINKIKNNSVLREFLPQVLSTLEIDLEDLARNSRLSFISRDQVRGLINELSVMRLVMKNIYSIIDNGDIIEKRFSEKQSKIEDILSNLSNVENNLDLTECQFTNFIIVTDRIRDLHKDIKDTFEAINKLSKEDLFNLSDITSGIIIKLDKKDLGKYDAEIVERALGFKYLENKIYNGLIETVVKQLDEFNLVHKRTDQVLKKVDL